MYLNTAPMNGVKSPRPNTYVNDASVTKLAGTRTYIYIIRDNLGEVIWVNEAAVVRRADLHESLVHVIQLPSRNTPL